jgi:Condensation domain
MSTQFWTERLKNGRTAEQSSADLKARRAPHQTVAHGSDMTASREARRLEAAIVGNAMAHQPSKSGNRGATMGNVRQRIGSPWVDAPFVSSEEPADQVSALNEDRHEPLAGVRLPMHPAQLKLWQDSRRGSLNRGVVIRAIAVRGPLNVGIFGESLRRLVRHHAALRASFPIVAGQPIQVVGDQAKVAFEVRRFPGSDSESLLRQLRAEAGKGIDMATGPMLQVTLFEQSADNHVVLVKIHHAVVDFWSLTILVEDFVDIYRALTAGADPTLPPAGDYPAFIRDYGDYLAGSEYQADREYWLGELADFPARLRLPAEISTNDGDSPPYCQFDLSEQLTRSAEQLSRNLGVTLNVTLLAAYQAFLHKLTGQRDIVIGTPVAGRTRPGSERLVGLCAHTKLIRVDLGDDPTFAALASRTRTAVINSIKHGRLLLGSLFAETRGAAEVPHTSAYQAAFAFFRAQQPALLDLAGLALGISGERQFGRYRVKSVEFGPEPTMLDLSLSAAVLGSRLVCAIRYNTALFGPRLIRILGDYYRSILTASVREPGRQISLLPGLPADADPK